MVAANESRADGDIDPLREAQTASAIDGVADATEGDRAQREIPAIIGSQAASATDNVADLVDDGSGAEFEMGNDSSADELECTRSDSSDITIGPVDESADETGSDRGEAIARKFNLAKCLNNTRMDTTASASPANGSPEHMRMDPNDLDEPYSDDGSGHTSMDVNVGNDTLREDEIEIMDDCSSDEMANEYYGDRMEPTNFYDEQRDYIDDYIGDDMASENNNDREESTDFYDEQCDIIDDYSSDDMPSENDADVLEPTSFFNDSTYAIETNEGHGEDLMEYVDEAIQVVHLAGIQPGIYHIYLYYKSLFLLFSIENFTGMHFFHFIRWKRSDHRRFTSWIRVQHH